MKSPDDFSCDEVISDAEERIALDIPDHAWATPATRDGRICSA